MGALTQGAVSTCTTSHLKCNYRFRTANGGGQEDGCFCIYVCGSRSGAGGGGSFEFQRPCLFAHISHHGDILKTRQAWLLHPLFHFLRKKKGELGCEGRGGALKYMQMVPQRGYEFYGFRI